MTVTEGTWTPRPAQPYEPGNTVAQKHGAYSARVVGPVAERIRAGLSAVAPWTQAPAYEATVAAWAWAEAQCEVLRSYLDEHGLLTEEGESRPASARLDRLEGRAANLRGQLGLDPMSMVKLLGGLSQIDGTAARDGLEALKAAGRELVQAAERRALEAASEPETAVGDDDREGVA